ncbi:MAG: hypothetical protein N2484_18140, partial [Clostridia bacterium]|nr:hypothetical protein [Clostridia bacterium]
MLKYRLPVLFTNSIAHALVDAACAALVVGIAGTGTTLVNAFSIVLLYNLLAFATQPLLGYMTDKLFTPSRVAAVGCLLTAAAIPLDFLPIFAVCVVGVGNALF